MKYDVIVVGGGPSGLMASIAAGEKGAKVLLIDKGSELGKKISDFRRRNAAMSQTAFPSTKLSSIFPEMAGFSIVRFPYLIMKTLFVSLKIWGIELKEEDAWPACSLSVTKHNPL